MNPFAFLFAQTAQAAQTGMLERAVDNAEYWKRELEKAERERDQWRDRCDQWRDRYYEAVGAVRVKP